jgi:hypothetical protein
MKYALVLMLTLFAPALAMAKGECEQDKQKFCAEVVKAQGNVGACLDEHKAEVSDACKKRLGSK